MCTLSFIPREEGYLIAMNRDERVTREVAQPPKIFELNDCRSVFPYENSGGTWIAANHFGIALALLNRNEQGNGQKVKSRGMVIRKLLAACDANELQVSMAHLDLGGTLPFRLVTVVPREKKVIEWSWNTASLKSHIHPWKQQHWFSSGLSDEAATRSRSAICGEAWRHPRAGTPTWLRWLHQSHRPERGAFSICVHRPDAQTVSYSQIACAEGALELRYRPGSPCARSRAFTAKLELLAA